MLRKSKSEDHEELNGSRESIYCPYCNNSFWCVDGFVGEEEVEEECGECGKKFLYWAEIDIRYYSSKKNGDQDVA